MTPRDWLFPPRCAVCGCDPRGEADAVAVQRLTSRLTASLADWSALAPRLCWGCRVRFAGWCRPLLRDRAYAALPDWERIDALDRANSERANPEVDAWFDAHGDQWNRALNGPYLPPTELDLADWMAWVLRTRPAWHRKMMEAA